MCNNMICGGFSKLHQTGNVDRSCVKWDEAANNFTTLNIKLKEPRDNLLCWGLPSGDVLLFGGTDDVHDTERVFQNGTSSEIAFQLDKNHKTIE